MFRIRSFSPLLVILVLSFHPESAAAWTSETVDTGGVGAHSSIKIDSADHIHIAYFANSFGYLKYAFYDGSQWHIETPDPQYLSGHYTSVDVDSSNTPHIGYRYYSGHSIRYASRTGGVWSISEFETDPDMEADISMRLDSHGLPHFSYWDGEFTGEPHDLKYAHFDGSTWATTVVDFPGDVGRGSSIALDSHDNPHISYYDQTNVTLKYAAFDGTAWRVQTIDNCETIAFNFRTAIAVDSRDRVHIVYSAYHYAGGQWRGRLKYAFFDGSTWSISTIEEGAPTRDFRVPAITIDRADRPEISYLIYYNSEPISPVMRYARFDGNIWRIEIVDPIDLADSDYSNGIDLDSSGRPHLSYSKRSTMLMHATGSIPANVAGDAGSRPSVTLLPPFPNPSREGATFVFVLPRAGSVDLGLYDVAGRRVRTLARGGFGTGRHAVRIGGDLPPGVYLGRIEGEGIGGSGSVGAAKLIVR
jgi:hypothetical protein